MIDPETRLPVGPSLIHALHARTASGNVFDLFLWQHRPTGFVRCLLTDGWSSDHLIDKFDVLLMVSAAHSTDPAARALLHGFFEGLAARAASHPPTTH